MFNHFLTALPNFLAYFAVAAIMLALFFVLYLNITPYDDIKLIRENNSAASLTLAGGLLGFAMPVANAIAHTETLLDLIMWGLVAGAVQLAAYGVVRLALPSMTEQIPAGHIAPATFLAALSITVGLLNAAAMAY